MWFARIMASIVIELLWGARRFYLARYVAGDVIVSGLGVRGIC